IRSSPFRVQAAGLAASFVLGAALFSHIAFADDVPAPSEGKSVASATTTAEPEEYKNWIEFGFGGVTVHGDEAQFEQEHRVPADQIYGGITDLHFEETFGKDVQLTLDGHALFDTNDYGLRFNLSKNKLGYIEVGYDEFR